MSLLDPSADLRVVLIAFLFTNLLAAAQDIATDGLAVDLLTEKDRGWANGIQVAGYRIGMVIGGGALLAIYDWVHWSGVMIGMALITLACSLPVFAFRDPKHTVLPDSRFLASEIFHFLLKPGAWAWAAVLLLYKCGHSAATGMLRPWLVDSGYTMTDIAWILGTAGFVAGFFGAMTGGALASKFSKNRARLLIVLGCLQCVSVMSYLWPLLGEHATYKVAMSAAFDHFTSGMATVALFTMMMDACSPERAAADYTLQACIVVLAQQLAPALSGLSAERFGYQSHFMISAAVSVGALGVTTLLLRRETTRRLLNPVHQSVTLQDRSD